MNTCETCRSWAPVKRTSFGECMNPKIKNEGDPPVDGLATAECLLDAMIYTGRDFGCVQWKPGKERKVA